MLIKFALIYFIGFLVSLWIIHRFKEQLGLDIYDPPHEPYYDDWESNAQAYTTFSAMWPFFWIICLLFVFGKMLVKLSEWIGKTVNRKKSIKA